MRFDDWRYIPQMIHEVREKREKAGQESADKEYWHYTSFGAFLNIFKDYQNGDSKPIDSFDLYATHIRFMNDEREFEDGVKFFEEFLNTMKGTNCTQIRSASNMDTLPLQAYLISFCDKGDLLSQWKWYGKNSGVALRVKTDAAVYSTYSLYDGTGKEIKNQYYDQWTRPMSVNYSLIGKKDYFDLLTDEKENIDHRYVKLIKPLFISYCKDEAFSEENESRLVFFTCEDLQAASSRAKFN